VKKRQRGQQNVHNFNLKLQEVRPLTTNQKEAFNSQNNLVLHGLAGTGKTFISSYLAYHDIEREYLSNLVIIRSAVPTRDIGFLPGTDKEKSAVYEEPYKDIATELFDRGDAYEILKQKGLVQFMTTSFIRGLTLRDSCIIVDECQNMSFHELDSIITRVGENCRIIFCGDFRQSDLKRNELLGWLKILRRMEEFDFIEFGVEDIVRSDFVKKYIIAKMEIEDES
jgi:phosphate starvation-inducible PhoH-like protein